MMLPSSKAVRNLVLTGVSCLAACAGYFSQLTPEVAHENFLRDLNSYIGKDINENKGRLRSELRLSQENIAGGLVRYRFGIPGGCIEDFDVDPSTNRIVAVGFEGTTRQCSIPS